jgi:hypothetical protein
MMLPENVCASKDNLSLTTNSNPYGNINPCTVPELTPSSSHFKVRITLRGWNRSTTVVAMVDSGATALFISKRFVKENRICTHLILHEIPLYNINGSKNHAGSITRATQLRLKVGSTEEWRMFLITELGPEDVVLGLPWLRSANLSINWAGGNMKVDSTTTGEARVVLVAANQMQQWRWWKMKVFDDPSERLWCTAGYSYSAELAEKAGKEKQKCTFEEIVLKDYQQYAKVFSEAESKCLPDHKSYDHTIDLKPETPEMIRSKIYPMPVNEQDELDRFLEEHLRKGYIIPSKSPIASPIFFIKKKDGRL